MRRHGDGNRDRRQPQMVELNADGRVRATVGVTHSRALLSSSARQSGSREREELYVLRIGRE